jgi:hypothetical protein
MFLNVFELKLENKIMMGFSETNLKFISIKFLLKF